MLEFEHSCEPFLTLPPDKLNFESLSIEENPVDSKCWRDQVLKDLRKLQRLRIEDTSNISSDDLLKVIGEGQCLQELSLPYAQLNEEVLWAIARDNKSLKTIRIEANSDTSPLARINDTAWSALHDHSPNLNLAMTCYLENEDDYEAVLTAPVTHLYLGGYPSSQIIQIISEKCPRLVELVINSSSSGVINKELITTAKGCPKLSAVGLGDCEITCSALVEFTKICKQRLRILHVWETSLIEDENFDVAEAVANISSLLGRMWTPEYVPPW